ncbi:WD repeat-containing protein 31-like [Dendronephthya gigantea]|uniref:WD repeat-containing protein 31-like n=1 Tax=Dendronephthya gigantea TaxID=151771 RepID=UPI00106A067D|nr:WD repeat-containing protein 31-like [Dendronephthya gigantea]
MGSKKSKPKRASRYESDTTANEISQAAQNEVKEFPPVHGDRVTCLAAYKPGICVSGSTDMSVGVFNYKQEKLWTRWKAHDKDITKVCCGDPQGQSIVFSSSRDKTIKSWLINDNNAIQLQCVYDSHELVVTAIDKNPDCSILCSGSRDNAIKLWDVERAQCLRTNVVTRNLITCVKWFSEDNLIAQVGEDKMLRIWDSRSLEVSFTFPPKQYFATCCDVSPDGRFVLTSSNGFNGSGCEVNLWDVRGRKQIYTYLGHEQTVSSCCFLPRLTDITSWPMIMSASHDSNVKIWNQENQKCVATECFFGSGPLTGIAVWEDGKFCVSSFNSGIYQLSLSSDGEGGIIIACQTHF